jgi:hypothetical protein
MEILVRRPGRYIMCKSTLLTLSTLLVLVSLVLSACGANNSPEGVARAFVDAVNARDRDKFVSLWSPDIRNTAGSRYDALVSNNMRGPEIKDIVVRDIVGAPNLKEVTLLTAAGKIQWLLKVEKLEGRWYIMMDQQY